MRARRLADSVVYSGRIQRMVSPSRTNCSAPLKTSVLRARSAKGLWATVATSSSVNVSSGDQTARSSTTATALMRVRSVLAAALGGRGSGRAFRPDERSTRMGRRSRLGRRRAAPQIPRSRRQLGRADPGARGRAYGARAPRPRRSVHRPRAVCQPSRCTSRSRRHRFRTARVRSSARRAPSPRRRGRSRQSARRSRDDASHVLQYAVRSRDRAAD